MQLVVVPLLPHTFRSFPQSAVLMDAVLCLPSQGSEGRNGESVAYRGRGTNKEATRIVVNVAGKFLNRGRNGDSAGPNFTGRLRLTSRPIIRDNSIAAALLFFFLFLLFLLLLLPPVNHSPLSPGSNCFPVLCYTFCFVPCRRRKRRLFSFDSIGDIRHLMKYP